MRTAWAIQGLGFLVLMMGVWFAISHLKPESSQTPAAPNTMAQRTMIVRSPAFGHEEVVPEKYTCDGEDISPPLAIDNIPAKTVSLALIMDDPDAPAGVWDHWIVFNIPATTTRIGEGSEPDGVAGLNSWGRLGYGGPCPPDGEHRYLMKVYALDTLLNLTEGSTKTELEHAMEGHILEKTTLMGRYARGFGE